MPCHMRSSAAFDSASAAMPAGSTWKYRFDRPPRCGVGSANQECTRPFASSRSSVAYSAPTVTRRRARFSISARTGTP